MNVLLRLEAAALFLLAYFASIQLPFAGWVFFAWLLAPDLSMIGYAVNPKLGAWTYNIVHHQGIAIVTGLLGYFLHHPSLELAGCVLLAHSAMDRVFGYGLKYTDAFKHTHLGWLNGEKAPAITGQASS